MVTVSCSTKFHAFNLAEQLDNSDYISSFYTTYAYQKNTLMRRFVSRVDNEQINPQKIKTILPLAVGIKIKPAPHIWNNVFDKWVARQIKSDNDYKIFIGWSGMSLISIRQAKSAGKITILERGSSHIEFQQEILKEEYSRYAHDFTINQTVIRKELQEYKEADFISIPSNFVKKTFIDKGIDEKKLIVNPYGTSFRLKNSNKKYEKFVILYLGSLLVRKGLSYLFDALNLLSISENDFEVWFVGSVEPILAEEIKNKKKNNWKFFGHVNHNDLPDLISQANIAVHPSLEEGLSMVIPQMMACGIPVISTTNTGGMDIIKDGKNGFIVPIKSPESIAEKIEKVYNDPGLLKQLSKNAKSLRDLSWDAYGKRYIKSIEEIIK